MFFSEKFNHYFKFFFVDFKIVVVPKNWINSLAKKCTVTSI